MIGLVLVLTLTAVGAVGSLFRPYVGVLAYVFFSIIRPRAMFPGVLPDLPYSQIVVMAALGGFALHGFGDWEMKRGRIAFFAMFAYLAWDLIAAWQAPYWSVAWAHVDSQLRIFIPCILAILIATTVSDVKAMAWTITLAEGMVALRFNEYYYLIGWNLLWGSFSGKDNNLWAMDMVVGALFCLFLLLASRPLPFKILFGVLGVLCVSAVMFSYSRGGMLALIVGGAAALLFLPKRPKFLGLFTAAVLVALFLAGPSVVEEFSTIFVEPENRDRSAAARLELWGDMIDVSLKWPIFGAGPNHFPLLTTEMGWERPREGHNLWLQFAAETGFPGLLTMLIFYLVPLWHLWGFRRPSLGEDEDGRTLRYLAGATASSIVAFLIASQFISIDLLEIPVFVATLGLMLLKVADRAGATAEEESTAAPRRSWATTPAST